MELRQLSYFVCVANTLHFHQAAQRLRVVPSAVSQQVAKLERELRVQLFDRSGRTVTLTPAGRHFLPFAHQVLTSAQAATDAVAHWRAADERTVRLGTSGSLGSRMTGILATAARLDPPLAIQLQRGDIDTRLALVRNHTLDAAIVHGSSWASAELELTEVWLDEVLVALPSTHPLAGGRDIDLADLAGLPLWVVARDRNPDLHDLVVTAAAEAGFTPVFGPEFGPLQESFAAIAVSGGAWTVFYRSHAETLALPGVRFLPVRPAPLMMPTFLATSSSRRLSGPVLSLLEICRSQTCTSTGQPVR